MTLDSEISNNNHSHYPVCAKRTRGRVIGVSVGMFFCLFVCLFVDTKTSSLSEIGQFMSSTYYVPVRNPKKY